MMRVLFIALSFSMAYSLQSESTSFEPALDWIDCETFFDHVETLAMAAGVPSPKADKSYTPHSCQKVFEYFKGNGNSGAVEGLVNLAHHLKNGGQLGSRRLGRRVVLEDVASKVRQLHAQQTVTTELFEDQSPKNFPRDLATLNIDYWAFDSSGGAEQITDCKDAANDECPHTACVAEYLFDGDFEFKPAYGGSTGYDLGTAVLKGTDFVTGLWNGKDTTRTNGDPTGTLEILGWAQRSAELVADGVCDALADDFEIPIVCFDLPMPFQIVCRVILAIVQSVGLVINTLKDQAAFQDSLVDGAEVEAAYENSRNLLHKQCAIFDQAVCRCQDEINPAGTVGQGCDGKDSNCNDKIDECAEDTVSPTISLSEADEGCSHKWFTSVADAQDCVECHVTVTDDCQEINQTTFDTVSSCGDSMVSISAMDQCMNPSDAELPVKIDDTPPTVSCSFAGEKDATVKRALTSKQMFDRGFEYDASDNCGGPLNVTVDVFSNEREGMWYRCDMAIFYNDKILHQTNNNGKLYLQENICPEPTNGQCLKDPNVKEARLYTIVVTAVDEAGLSSSGECTMTIEPVDKTPPTSTSTQRIHLNSYYSIFNTP